MFKKTHTVYTVPADFEAFNYTTVMHRLLMCAGEFGYGRHHCIAHWGAVFNPRLWRIPKSTQYHARIYIFSKIVIDPWKKAHTHTK